MLSLRLNFSVEYRIRQLESFQGLSARRKNFSLQVRFIDEERNYVPRSDEIPLLRR
jgi:hypothetical protein